MDDLKSKPNDLPLKAPIKGPINQTLGQPPPSPSPPPPLTPPPEPKPPIFPRKEEKADSPYPPPPTKKPSRKKLAMVAFSLLLIIFGGISVATAWKLRQVEKVTPEEAEAWIGDHCAGDCEITIGPGNLTFEAAGHGFRWHCLSQSDCELYGSEVKNVDIYVPFPTGATIKETYAIWSGEGCHNPTTNGDCIAENDANIKINGYDTPATKSFIAQNPKFPTNTQAANIAKLKSESIPSPSQGKLKFTVGEMGDFYANGHGVSIIVIYEKQGVGYNKIVLKLWGEWLYLACAPHDTRTAECEGARSKVMTIDLPDLDTTKASNNKFAWFCGEGEIDSRDTSKKNKACIDDEGQPRPSHLYYQVPDHDWDMLSPTDAPPAPFAWFACPMDPGGWWVSRVTGVNMPLINLTGNYIKFAADSAYVAGETEYDGESYTFAGIVAQYPVEQPELACLSLEGEPDPSGLSPGEEITLTCTGSSDPDPINHFEFRVSSDSGTPVELPTAVATQTNGTWEGTTGYTIPDYACYDFECRACRSSDSSDCTAWGEAE